jgi:hypothetical protein
MLVNRCLHIRPGYSLNRHHRCHSTIQNLGEPLEWLPETSSGVPRMPITKLNSKEQILEQFQSLVSGMERYCQRCSPSSNVAILFVLLSNLKRLDVEVFCRLRYRSRCRYYIRFFQLSIRYLRRTEQRIVRSECLHASWSVACRHACHVRLTSCNYE